MKTNLSFLLLLIAALFNGSQAGDDDKTMCEEDVVPGIERTSRGIDITELDLTPPFQSRNMLGGLRSRLIDFTCNSGEKWKHPQTEVIYQVPDQVQRPVTLPAGSLRAVAAISGDSEDLKKKWSLTVGGGAELEKFGFSASATYKTAQEDFHQNNQTVAETTCAVSTHVVEFKLPKHLTFTEDFADFFEDEGDSDDGKVKTYEEARHIYDKFIKQFGTHYFESGTFGGTMYVRTRINEAYVSSNTEKSLETNLEATFLSKFNAKVETSSSTNKVTDTFLKNTHSEIGYYGGKVPEGITTEDFDWFNRWTDEVNKDPWLTGGRIKSIAELFTGEKKARKKEVRKAIRVHLAKAYLLELKDSVRMGRYKLTPGEMKNVTEAEHKLKDKSSKTVDETVEMLDSIFLQIRTLKDRIRLQQLRALWEESLLDIINCKSYVINKCTTFEWEKFEREADALMDFYEEIKTKTDNFDHQLAHEDMSQLYRDARRVADVQRQSLNMCANLAKPDHCKACVKQAILTATSHETQPFCTTREARDVVKWVV